MASVVGNIGQFLHYYFFRGGDLLGNGWDGEDCHEEVPLEIKRGEAIVWTIAILFCAWFFQQEKTFFRLRHVILDMRKSEKHAPVSVLEKFLDNFFLLACGFGTFMLIYYKVLMRYMIYLLQPCHLTLALHFITFLDIDRIAPIASLLWLPMTGGTMSAILFPSTSELVQPYEKEMYWVEHVLIQIVPLYLLVRRRGAIVKHFSWQYVLLGNLVVMCMHWWLFELTNNFFRVNVNFFTCPTNDLRIHFHQLNAHLPPFLQLPSYRNFFMFLFIVASVVSCVLYVTVARGFVWLMNAVFGTKAAKQKKN